MLKNLFIREKLKEKEVKKMKRTSYFMITILVLILAVAFDAHAVLIDFEGLAEGTLITNQYAGVTFTQDDGGSPMIDNKSFLYAYESSSGGGVLTGSMTGGAPFPTVAGMIAIFDSPVAKAGAFFSDTGPLSDYNFTAYDAASVVIGSFTILLGDPSLPTISNDPTCDSSVPWDGTGCGRFVGFDFGSNNMKSIQFGPSVAYGDAFAIDDFTYEAVPEPATLILLGSGLIGVGFAAKKRFKKQSN